MEFFGYIEQSTQGEQAMPSKLQEITISASPSELRAVAQFLQEAADSIEANGGEFEHEHFPRTKDADPELIVFNPDTSR